MKTRAQTIRSLPRFVGAILLTLGLASCRQTSGQFEAPSPTEQAPAASIEGLWETALTDDEQQARAKDQAAFEANPGPEMQAIMRDWHALENTRMSVGPASFTMMAWKSEPVSHEYQLDRSDGKLTVRFAMKHHAEESYTIQLDDDRRTMDWIGVDGAVHRWRRVDGPQ